MERTTFVDVFKRWWITLVVAMLIGGVTGYVIADRAASIYEAEARILVGPISADGTTLRAAGQLTQTYAELATTRPLLDIAASQIEDDDGRFGGQVTVLANDVTRLLTVRVRSEDPTEAAAMANAVAAVLDAETRAEVVRPEGQLRVVESAEAPTAPTTSNATLLFLLSVLSALVAAAGLVLLLDYLADAVQEVDELQALTGAGFVAEIARRKTPLVPLVRSRIAGDEEPTVVDDSAVRVAATTLQLSLPEEARTLVVAGIDGSSASASFAGRLAAVLAREGTTVSLVDGIQGEALQAAGVPSSEVPELDVGSSSVTLRVGSPTSVQVLGSSTEDVDDEAQVRSRLDELRRHAGWVLVHVGSVEGNAAALVWARAADGVLLVAQRGSGRRKTLAATAGQLRRVGGSIVGAVLCQPGWDRPVNWPWRIPMPSQFAGAEASERQAAPDSEPATSDVVELTGRRRSSRNGVDRHEPGEEAAVERSSRSNS